jgi:hypothetical protein
MPEKKAAMAATVLYDGSSSRLPNKAYETASRREAESSRSKIFPPYVRYRTELLNEINDNKLEGEVK